MFRSKPTLRFAATRLNSNGSVLKACQVFVLVYIAHANLHVGTNTHGPSVSLPRWVPSSKPRWKHMSILSYDENIVPGRVEKNISTNNIISKCHKTMTLPDISTVTPCLHTNDRIVTIVILASMNCSYKKMTIQLALEHKKL